MSLSAVALLSIQCTPMGPPKGLADRPVDVWGRGPGDFSTRTVSTGGSTSASGLLGEVRLRNEILPRGRAARKFVRPMTPRYITIHSTQNWSADASKHSQALHNGALRARRRPGGNRIGFLIWHFTVDDRCAIQHLPTSEQGEHADFDGLGNRSSIGIEMCEQRGSNRNATIERTAKLTAYLMYKNGIPLSNVVPHYHWPRRGCNPAHKNCPWFLLDNGRPGRKWAWFKGKVNYHYKRLQSQSLASN